MYDKGGMVKANGRYPVELRSPGPPQYGEKVIKDHGCCVVTASGSSRQTVEIRNSDGDRPTRKFVRRFLSIAGWIIPGAMLAILPKCPVCLAAYVAIGTGVGLSISSATYLRMALLIIGLTSLLYLAAKGLRRIIFWIWASRQYRTPRLK